MDTSERMDSTKEECIQHLRKALDGDDASQYAISVIEDTFARLEIERQKEIQEWRRVAGSRKGKISHLKAILEVLNTNNEIASLHDRELWSLHGELQKTITEAII